MRINPTVGRMVLFIAGLGDTLYGINSRGQPLAAQVAHVNGDGTLNVGVLDRDGNHHARQRVKLVQEEDAFNPDENRCEWMSFQKGQAASQGSDIDKRVTDLEAALPQGLSEVGEAILVVESNVGSINARVDELEIVTSGMRNAVSHPVDELAEVRTELAMTAEASGSNTAAGSEDAPTKSVGKDG